MQRDSFCILLLLRVHGWKENTRQRFHVFTLRHRNVWTTGVCARDPCYKNVSTDAIDLMA